MQDSYIFALDIGTRKIAGLLLKHRPPQPEYIIEHACLEEQLPGAMHDGQIHDIRRTSQVIQSIKSHLEAESGRALDEAAVAAAGRSLHTQRASVERKLPLHTGLSEDEVKGLELKAVTAALNNVDQGCGSGASDTYLCVGYSVIGYSLDDTPITSLAGHKGQRAGVEVIATFLPSIVVNSLSASLTMSSLSMASLTLEPIAAIHLVVPNTMRMLNIALVDVGAGTSDIAISKEGTVCSYGMVPSAGDEITEVIAENYLLDFMVAETLKRQLLNEEPLTCHDALGNALELERDEVLQVIEPAVEDLVHQIAQEILRQNETAPKGVILVGGGSLTPGLPQKLAEQLGLPAHLVRLRVRENLDHVQGTQDFAGPQVITPIAIGAAHLDNQTMALQTVTVNGSPFQFLKLQDSTVGDALVHAGLNARNFYGRPGEAVTIWINDQKRTFPGSMGGAALLRVNGEPAGLRTKLEDRASIAIDQPEPGDPAQPCLGDIVDADGHQWRLTIQGQRYRLGSAVTVNGNEKPKDYILQDRDRIAFTELRTAAEALRHLGIQAPDSVTFVCNGQSMGFPVDVHWRIDGLPQPLSTPLRDGMEIEYDMEKPTVQDLLNNSSFKPKGIEITLNGRPMTMQPPPPTVIVNGCSAASDRPLCEGDEIKLSGLWEDEHQYILSDIFRILEPDQLPRSQVEIFVNGSKTGFTHTLKDGDAVEIRLKQEEGAPY